MFIDKFSVSGEDFLSQAELFLWWPFHELTGVACTWRTSTGPSHRPWWWGSSQGIRIYQKNQSPEYQNQFWGLVPYFVFLVHRSYLCLPTSINQLVCYFMLMRVYFTLSTSTLHSSTLNLSVISYLLMPAHFNQPACSSFHTYLCPLHSSNLSFQTHWRKPDQTLIFFSRVL